MKLVRNSSEVPDVAVERIVRFLKKSHQSTSTVALEICTTDPEAPGAAFMTGDSYPNGGWLRGLKQRHYIRLYVPTLQRPYPVSQQNPAGDGRCPVVALRSWMDELVLLLAHEFAHIDQFEAAIQLKDSLMDIVVDEDGDFEVAAETIASAVLVQWRKYVGRYCRGCQLKLPLNQET